MVDKPKKKHGWIKKAALESKKKLTKKPLTVSSITFKDKQQCITGNFHFRNVPYIR